ncbi:uncharacterized protein DS421_2g48010 [Arachis hypogaea]|nr:uncharacterized protein DS421_2g48010 [Arachis hypogaea]
MHVTVHNDGFGSPHTFNLGASGGVAAAAATAFEPSPCSRFHLAAAIFLGLFINTLQISELCCPFLFAVLVIL